MGFSVVDTVNNRYLFDLNEGDVLDIDLLEQEYMTTGFTIVCNTSGRVESTFMTDPYDATANVEANEPWTLAGDENGSFTSSPFRENPGAWNVTCQPFCGDVVNGENTGNAGAVANINFNVTALDCSTCIQECIRITGK